MKLTKRLFGLFLALTLFCALAGTAFAVDITITDDSSVTADSYAAYKLLNATVAENAGEEGGYAYTLNSTYTAILQEVTGKTTEAEIIKYISELDDTGIRTFADAVYAEIVAAGESITPDYTTDSNTFSNVEQGYYLIAETDTEAHPDTTSLVMLDTAGLQNITIESKENAPKVEKKVKDTDDSTGAVTDWQDSADYDIGDTIPYQITGTVSDKIANYKNYQYTFTDTMTNLTCLENTVKVYLVNGTNETEITRGFTKEWNSTSKILTVAFANLKSVDGVVGTSKIVVRYDATLDASANIGYQGNPNTVYLTYSRNPYTNDTNDTPKDTNIVFTFKGVVNKVDADNKPLLGAGFTLYKFDKNENDYVAVGEELKGIEMTTFEFIGLDAGQYKIVETTVPAGYNKAEDIEFVIVAEHEVEADLPKLTSLVVKDKDGKTISGEDLTFTATVFTGEISTNIVNNSGVELPSTGGVGTTIFYIVGGLMVFAAGVLLITRKRMNDAE